ncbi:hypothetical protein [Streptacidiphilus jiangxiensis]|uniref:hypothetical protein n=1 Tax=Streptacidiphilus jiangxiensis TaxID=235985 RepID=UPI000A73456D|nr:hypothetical protein [Streptacidiphilus jiangxiensis]
MRECPHLLDGCHAVRVRNRQLFGVMGTFYTFDRELSRLETDGGETTYDVHRIRGGLGAQRAAASSLR